MLCNATLDAMLKAQSPASLIWHVNHWHADYTMKPNSLRMQRLARINDQLSRMPADACR
jgi:hypothetical protein